MADAEKFQIDFRRLSDEEDYHYGSTMAQVFSGALFSALVVYLIFSNSTRMSYIQRASLEKRLHVCCHINTIVAALSAFFNFFQVTEVDNWFLPGNRNFTVDMARPIEWILTCPLMQLCLVLMGGSRIPEYRRVLMPAFSVVVLAFGSFTLFVEPPMTYICWGCGLCTHCVAMYFNRLQIIEHSKGVEGLMTGDSEFRKATLILMGTWLPFPLWFILSPEGVGLIENIVIIQMGWAFLNITAKFTSAFYMQRIKDNYCNRLKVKREMKGGERAMTSMMPTGDFDEVASNDGSVAEAREKVNGDLTSCVIETMNFLGMAENVERFLRLLQQARVFTLEDIGQLNRHDCEELQLPFDLVTALQKRQKVWKLEMVDDSEKALEACEKHHSSPAVKDQKRRRSLENALAGTGGAPMSAQVTPQGYSSQDQLVPGSPNASQQSIPPMQNWQNAQEEQRLANFGNEHAIDVYHNPVQNGSAAHPTSPEEFLKNNKKAMQEVAVVQQANLEPLEKRMEKLESRLLEKFEQAINMVGKKIELSQEKFATGLANGLQDVSKAMERSQTMLEAKVEFVFASQNQKHEQNQAGMQSKFEAVAEKVFQRAASVRNAADDANTAAVQAMQKSLADATSRLQELQASQQKLGSDLSASIAQVSDGWAHQMVQDSKAAAFTLHTRIGAMEENQNKKATELEQKIAQKVQQLVTEGTENLRSTVVQQMQGFTEKVNTIMDSSKQAGAGQRADEQGRLEDLSSMIKSIGQDCSKNIEVGIGIFGNSLRSQLENMQAAQLQQRMETETSISNKLDGFGSRLQAQTQSQAEKMSKMLEANIKESTEKAAKTQTDIKDFRQHWQDTSKTQQDKSQDMHSMISSVLEQAIGAKDRSAECSERVALLYEQLGGHHEPMSPSGRPQTAGSRPPPGGASRTKYSQYGMHVMNG